MSCSFRIEIAGRKFPSFIKFMIFFMFFAQLYGCQPAVSNKNNSQESAISVDHVNTSALEKIPLRDANDNKTVGFVAEKTIPIQENIKTKEKGVSESPSNPSPSKAIIDSWKKSK